MILNKLLNKVNRIKKFDQLFDFMIYNWNIIKYNLIMFNKIKNKINKIENISEKNIFIILFKLINSDYKNILDYIYLPFCYNQKYSNFMLGFIFFKFNFFEMATKYFKKDLDKFSNFMLYKITNDEMYLISSLKQNCYFAKTEAFVKNYNKGIINMYLINSGVKKHDVSSIYWKGRVIYETGGYKEGYILMAEAYNLYSEIAGLFIYDELTNGTRITQNICEARKILFSLCERKNKKAYEIMAFILLNENQQEIADDLLLYLYDCSYNLLNIGNKLKIINHNMADLFLNKSS